MANLKIPNYYAETVLSASSLTNAFNDILLYWTNATQSTISFGLVPSVLETSILITSGKCQGLNVNVPWLNNGAGNILPTVMEITDADTLELATTTDTSGYIVVNANLTPTVSGNATYTSSATLALVPSLTESFPTGSLIGQVCIGSYANVNGILTINYNNSASRITLLSQINTLITPTDASSGSITFTNNNSTYQLENNAVDFNFKFKYSINTNSNGAAFNMVGLPNSLDDVTFVGSTSNGILFVGKINAGTNVMTLLNGAIGPLSNESISNSTITINGRYPI